MSKDFTITVRADCERGRDFEKIFGTRTVHVKSPIPCRANLTGRGECWIFELDLSLITEEQRQRLVEHIATRFKIPAVEVAAELNEQGVPILAEDVVMSVENPQRWF